MSTELPRVDKRLLTTGLPPELAYMSQACRIHVASSLNKAEQLYLLNNWIRRLREVIASNAGGNE